MAKKKPARRPAPHFDSYSGLTRSRLLDEEKLTNRHMQRRRFFDVGGDSPSSDWILATGFWNDGGFWRDVELWKDGV